MRRLHLQSGFTIIELLVAMGIATLMGFLINLIFIEATDAVSRGIATSKVINNSRTLGDQLEADFRHLHKPNAGDGGTLVIIGRTYGTVAIMDSNQGGPIASPRPIRSDQIAFIYDNTNIDGDFYEPITPDSTLNFGNDGTADYARIWYGHVLKTNPDGSDPTTPVLGNDPSTNNDPNSYAHQWMLGRQALFLDKDTSLPVHTTSLAPNSFVSGYSSTPDIESSLVNAAGEPYFKYGLTDVAYFSYNDDDFFNAPAGAPVASGGLERLVVSDTQTYALLQDISLGQTEATYQTNAIGFLTFADDFLRGNPFPGGNTFWSSQVAQMHPCFMENVSDFIVEFAADVDNDSEIDRDATTGALIWYSPTDTIDWSAHTYDPAASPAVLSVFGNADNALVFRHDYTDYWPHLLRFRVRIHDPRGSLMDTNDALLTDGFDNDGDGLIDSAGGDFDEYTEPGLWFEFIVKVNRS